jgi:hypothetical protein
VKFPTIQPALRRDKAGMLVAPTSPKIRVRTIPTMKVFLVFCAANVCRCVKITHRCVLLVSTATVAIGHFRIVMSRSRAASNA